MLVGVTGNMSVGKSTFISMLSSCGADVFDTDLFVDSLYRKEEIREEVRREFGPQFVGKGSVDKKALAKAVFSDHHMLEKLNAFIHPMIRGELMKINHEGRVVIAEVPLLFEAQMDDLFDKIILVTCPQEIAIERAAQKGFSRDDYLHRIRFQWPDEKKISVADFAVNSGCSMDELKKQAEQVSLNLLKGEKK